MSSWESRWPSAERSRCPPTPQPPRTAPPDRRLALGPDGNIYVGELNGENPNTARVYKFSRRGKLLGWIGGFTMITGIAFGPHGTLYVSELFHPAANPPTPPSANGDVVKVSAFSRNAKRTTTRVPFPAGLAVDRHANVYVSAWSIAPDTGFKLPGATTKTPPGQVLRLRH